MTISEVCQRFALTPDTLRYYEREGLIPRVQRTGGRIRDYSERDCTWIEFVKCMRASGVQVEALAEYVRLFQQGDATWEARKHILIQQRDRIAAQMVVMQRSLERLNGKIERYEKVMVPVERELVSTPAE